MMPLKHEKRTDYIGEYKQKGLPFKLKKVISRKVELSEPEKEQTKLCGASE